MFDLFRFEAEADRIRHERLATSFDNVSVEDLSAAPSTRLDIYQFPRRRAWIVGTVLYIATFNYVKRTYDFIPRSHYLYITSKYVVYGLFSEVRGRFVVEWVWRQLRLDLPRQEKWRLGFWENWKTSIW